jgi:hypothetical protein
MTRLEPFACDGTISRAETTSRFNRAALEALLLGLRLRGWLTERERELLDSLAPERSTTFVIHGERYLHPEGLQLFPFELIEAAIHKGGDAIFTHRYRRDTNKASYHYTIYTAVINWPASPPLVLGFFGPDDQMKTPEVENRFHELVTLFRETYHSHHECAERLQQQLASDTPVIIVNRCSGRVVTLNEDAADLLHTDTIDLVDRELGEIRVQLGDLLPGHRLTMTNINEDELFLTIITLTAAAPSHQEREPSTSEDLFIIIEEKLDELALLAGELKTIGRQTKDGDVLDLSSRMLDTIDELKLHTINLRHLRFLCRQQD